MGKQRRVSRWGIGALVGALTWLVAMVPPAPAQPGGTPMLPPPPFVAERAVAPPRTAPQLPPRFRDEVVVDGLDQPTSVAFAPDGRVFVAEKSGVVLVLHGLDDPTPTVFADLSTQVDNLYDRGLLSLALDSGFPARPYVYVSYAYDHVLGDPDPAPRWGTPGVLDDDCPDPPGATDEGCVVSGRVSRLTARGDTMAGDERVLVEDFCLQFPSHAMGSVVFGPDGMLYASAGDGASYTHLDHGQTGNPCGDPEAEGGSLRSQDLRTDGDPVSLDGTVIRIDPATGLGAPDNPLHDSDSPTARRIIATGLRNPFRLAFRPGTSQLYVGDVGSSRFEEVNRIEEPAQRVENFGWPCYEGPGRNPGWDALDLPICEGLYAEEPAVVPPFFGYQARGGRVAPDEDCPTGSSAVSGVAFPTSTSYPASYRGALIFSDFARSCIWSLAKRDDGSPDPTRPRILVEGARSPVGLVTGPGGDLYYVELGLDDLGYPDPAAGAVHRIRHYPDDQPPVVRLRADRTSGPVPLPVRLDASGSSDPEGARLTYAWDLDGDGAHDDATGAAVTRTFTKEATVRVGVRVTDPSGLSAVDTVRVFAGDTAPELTIESPAESLTWRVGQLLHLRASATDPDEGDGVLDADRMTWDLTVQHCPSVCHSHPVQRWVGRAGVDVRAPDHEYPSRLLLTASATDARGLTVRRSIRLAPRTARVRVTSRPDALLLHVGDRAKRAAWGRTYVLGSRLTLTAPRRQVQHGRTYVFRRWSDGGEREHVVQALRGVDAYEAVYRRR